MHADYTFESFIHSPETKFACLSAMSVANAPRLIYNPLVLYGPNGTGKTHLLHAIGNRIRSQDPQRQPVCSTCDEFIAHMVNALVHRDNSALERIYLDPEILLLDDVHHFAWKTSTQEMLLQIFRQRVAAGKLTVITSNLPPEELPMLGRLMSTVDSTLCASIAPPQADTRLAVARVKAASIGLPVTDAPLIYISNHTDNIRQIEGALKRILAYLDLGLFEPTTANIMKMLSEEWLPTIQKNRN